jgi:ABC-type dipeptide/oligopeptide/nickel transport system permease subunit
MIVEEGEARLRIRGPGELDDFAHSLFPGLVIALVALAINFVGDGVRDALDPTQRRVR